ncbi:hypothetical protein QR680_000176 [Steinernema hermaphroditum]|uniref:Ground-like domain-containing protein n=1 Tax=Steinernema hermaphroditum TaxID=289476 RepID=A0AA39GVP5_9BILA|nr:hypothetical protein QR680_000176 [Steinernema hermaphroditum]
MTVLFRIPGKYEMPRSTMLLVFTLVAICGSALSLAADEDIERLKSAVAQTKAREPYCEVIQGSKNARLISSNVDEIQRNSAIFEQTYDDIHIDVGRPNKKSIYDNVLLRLKLGRYAEHICDAEKFRPYVKELGVLSFTCTEVCYKCFPGSFAVCYVKNRMFPGVAQTCLCSYDREQPINRAAFSLKQGGVIMPNLLRFH